MPEALIASMLPPDDFASYYAVGSESKTKGQAVFVEIDPQFKSDYLPIQKGLERCVPHKDGRPKRSVYISVYRVLEHIPLSSMRSLYLVTRDGRALPIDSRKSDCNDSGLHLYLELAPARPTVVSSFGPLGFYELLMGRRGGFQGMPAIAFVELRLGELAIDPENGAIQDLPYENIEHLRSCLAQIKTKDVASKIFDRSGSGTFLYRTIKHGIFVGNAKEGLKLYPFPDSKALKEKHYAWWRSANM
jgi:hypothetical protein